MEWGTITTLVAEVLFGGGLLENMQRKLDGVSVNIKFYDFAEVLFLLKFN